MERDEQTPEELEAHYGPGGPVDAGRAWLEKMILEEDVGAAWKLMAHELRLAFAQAWIYENPGYPPIRKYSDRDAIAAALAAEDPSHELWPEFAKQTRNFFRRDTLAEYDPETWGFASRPRPVGIDLEEIRLFDTGGEVVTVEQPTQMFGVSLVMRREGDRWALIGIGGKPAEPGWPPDLGLEPA